MRPETKSVYGPVWTRRFGWDLGINLLPLGRKLCTFDCVYCQYGSTPVVCRTNSMPVPDALVAEWDLQVHSCESAGMGVHHTTVSGNGEPTMHPKFAAFARHLVLWRNRRFPSMKLAILTNGYRLHDSTIREAVELFDEPIVKLDAATSAKWLAINQPLVPFSVDRLIETLQQCNHVMLQTMFLKGMNDGPADLEAWKAAIAKIKPREVQIYTVTRTTAIPDILPVRDADLLAIAEEATRELGIPVRAYL